MRTNPHSMTHDLRTRLDAFLRQHTTLTLATIGPDGPYAAAMFYAHDLTFGLYFLSDPNTQHCRNLAAEPRCAATVQADGQDWQQITGLQIRGWARPISTPEDWDMAYEIFQAKYPFVGQALAGTSDAGLALAGPLARSRFYRLTPQWLRLIDNRWGFGHKEELMLREV